MMTRKPPKSWPVSIARVGRPPERVAKDAERGTKRNYKRKRHSVGWEELMTTKRPKHRREPDDDENRNHRRMRKTGREDGTID